MKKLASVLVLGLAVSGIGGCGDDAPVPRPEAGVGDGGTKVATQAAERTQMAGATGQRVAAQGILKRVLAIRWTRPARPI